MPRNQSNRIEVDLKLLEDKNAEKLIEFGKQFDKSIDKLATLVGSWAQQVEGAAGVSGMAPSGAGKPGPDASTSSKVTIAGGYARMGGQGGGGTGFDGGGQPSMPANALPQAQPASGSSFEQQYITATKRIGEIPVGFRQTLGYVAEGGFGGANSELAMDKNGYLYDARTGEVAKDASGQPVLASWTRRTAGNLNDQLFRMQAIRQNAVLAMAHLQHGFGMIQTPTLLGQQLGASREGLFGTGFLSPAFKLGLSQKFQALKLGDFGFNPSYSVSDAQKAYQTIESFGYSGNQSNIIADQLKQLQIHQGIDPTTAMSMLDPYLRFGGPNDFQQLVQVLQDIPGAAYAAKMNLSQFQQELIQTATSVAQATGMTVGNVAAALNAGSTVTGLAPSRFADILSNPQTAIQAMGMTGKSLYQIEFGNNTLAPRMEFGMHMWKSIMNGLSPQQLLSLQKTDPGKFEQIMSGATLLWNQNKDIFGGLNPREMLTEGIKAGSWDNILKHISTLQQLQLVKADQSGSVRADMNLLKGFGGTGTSTMVHQFTQDLIKDQQKYTKDGKLNMAAYREAAHAQALALVNANQRNQQNRAAKQVTIVLSGDAAKYFKLIDKATGQAATPYRNAAGGWERAAMDLGKTAVDAASMNFGHLPSDWASLGSSIVNAF